MLVLAAAAALLGALAPQPLPAEGQTEVPGPRDLTEVTLEDLAGMEVVTVSKRPEAREHVPAAVHVITGEQARRSGYTSLAELLRLAPGTQVGRINASQPAVGIRGFASRLSRAVLLLLDGRSVYSPLFAGVYWETQDTLIEDIERIEVIRGPGGTAWGTNAVDGVVSVITKSAERTQGWLATGSVGTEVRAAGALRYGGHLGEKTPFRVYASYADRGPSAPRTGHGFDAWEMLQAGFRADRLGSRDRFTVQGDSFGGDGGQRVNVSSYTPPFLATVDAGQEFSGTNLLGRYERSDARGTLSAQAFFDHTWRREAVFHEDRDTFDADLQYRRRAGARNLLSLGASWRLTSGAAVGAATVAFTPVRRTDHLWSGFLEDELTLLEGRLRLIGGSRFEHNSYSGFEAQPSFRALYAPSAGHWTVWGAVSRALRTPSRVEHDLMLTAAASAAEPRFFRVEANPAFVAEEALAYELGGRVRRGSWLSVDVAGFWNDVDHYSSLEPGPPFQEGDPPRTVIPFRIGNGLRVAARGVEVGAEARASHRLRVYLAYAFLDLEARPAPGSADTTSKASLEGSAAHHTLRVHTSLSTGPVTFDLIARSLGGLPAQRVPAYATLDARVGWRAGPHVELALVGNELLQSRHAEFGANSASGTELQRAVSLKATLQW